MNYTTEDTVCDNATIFSILDTEADVHECCRCASRFYNFRQFLNHKANQCQDNFQNNFYTGGGIMANQNFHNQDIDKQQFSTFHDGSVSRFNQESQMSFLCNDGQSSYHTSNMYSTEPVSGYHNNQSLPSISTVNSQQQTHINYSPSPILMNTATINQATEHTNSQQNYTVCPQLNEISSMNISDQINPVNSIIPDDDIHTTSQELITLWQNIPATATTTGSQMCSELVTSNTTECNMIESINQPNISIEADREQKTNIALLQAVPSNSHNYVEDMVQQVRVDEQQTSPPTTNNSVEQQQQQQPNYLEDSDSETNKISSTNKSKHHCNHCGKSFNKNFDLTQHVRSHTGEKPFQCIACGRAFAQKSNVKKHMASHKVWLKGAYFRSLSTDANDLSENIDLSFLCEYCGKTFPSYNKRKTHLATHKDKQVYKCPKEDCSCTFKDLDNYVAHIKEHGSEITYRCHQCPLVFKTLEDIGLHEYQSHLDYPAKTASNGTPTKDCSRRFYSCQMCPSKFSHPASLNDHITNDPHHHPCHICHNAFTCERYLRKHLLLQHKKQEVSKCNVCDRSFRSVYYLRQHMLIHTKELPFSCYKCQAAFNRKDKLKRHLLIHEKVKKFKCPFEALGCKKEFSRNDKLKEHINSHKSSKQSHKCSFCNKIYSRLSCKVKHEKMHKSPLSCTLCDKIFVTKAKMKSHKCNAANHDVENSNE